LVVILHGAALAAGALIVLYAGFMLGQQFEANPEQRKALLILTVIVALLAGALAWSLTVR